MNLSTKKTLLAATCAAGLSMYTLDTTAAPTAWTPKGPAARAQIAGGPWVLAQGTVADPFAGFPTDNPGTSAFQPYYHAFTTGNDKVIQGYFDYRPKDHAEAVVAAKSSDSGKTWTFQSKGLAYLSPSLDDAGADAGAASDAGEGHPFVLTIQGRTFLYTLDRSPTNVDIAGLLVHEITPSASDPLHGLPSAAFSEGATPLRTTGLTKPDGIVGVVPGSSPLEILYVAKDTSVTPNVASVHLAQTDDGLVFTNDRVVSGLTDATTSFIGPRGTVVKYADGHYGLFFSAGLVGEDADAFHYVGYAESSDRLTWTVVNGVANPLLSIDATKDARQQTWYAGRVYAPSVTLSADGCDATMMFAGYKTTKPKTSLNDYRQVGVIALGACATTPVDAGSPPDSGTPDAGAVGGGDGGGSADASSARPDAGSGGSGGTGGGGGCSEAAGDAGAPGYFLTAGVLALAAARRRRALRARFMG